MAPKYIVIRTDCTDSQGRDVPAQYFLMNWEYRLYSDIISDLLKDLSADDAIVYLRCEPEAMRRVLVLMRYLTSIAKLEDLTDHNNARIIFAYTDEQRDTMVSILTDPTFVLPRPDDLSLEQLSLNDQPQNDVTDKINKMLALGAFELGVNEDFTATIAPCALEKEAFTEPKYQVGANGAAPDQTEVDRLKKQDILANMMILTNYLGWPFGIDATGICVNHWIFDKLSPEQLAEIIAKNTEVDA